MICERKCKATIWMDGRTAKTADSASDQLQGDQRRSKCTCEDWSNYKMPMWSQAWNPHKVPLMKKKKETCCKGYNLLKHTLTGLKRNWATISGLMKAGLFCFGSGGCSQMTEIKLQSLCRQWSTGVKASWYGDVSQTMMLHTRAHGSVWLHQNA